MLPCYSVLNKNCQYHECPEECFTIPVKLGELKVEDVANICAENSVLEIPDNQDGRRLVGNVMEKRMVGGTIAEVGVSHGPCLGSEDLGDVADDL